MQKVHPIDGPRTLPKFNVDSFLSRRLGSISDIAGQIESEPLHLIRKSGVRPPDAPPKTSKAYSFKITFSSFSIVAVFVPTGAR